MLIVLSADRLLMKRNTLIGIMIRFKAHQNFPFKITKPHIDIAKEYMEKHIASKLTIQSLKNHIESVEGLQPLSWPGIRHLWTKILKYPYKKTHKLPK